ncbi:polymer-forming cytoskeletal protein [Oceanicaulis sp. MMSF_3324]|uniref:bactofilin family protein n=1 Tax=Oceanicaulis sp. MMSF_3324 TaxID=3046702 RepID=UPI00273E8D88|nr:polymer-forming cytoskeletal protein [Oceanicaulis sp. MMSF_3324]
MKAKAPSILSADLKITGSIVSDGEVQLDGTVEGDVRATDLTIGEEASIKGEVIAENVVIRGRVNGSVRARQVQLSSTARVEGDVIHATLAIESGAYFDGLCKRSSDPLSDVKSPPANAKPAAQSTSSGSGSGSSTGSTASSTTPPPAAAASSDKAVANDPFTSKS